MQKSPTRSLILLLLLWLLPLAACNPQPTEEPPPAEFTLPPTWTFPAYNPAAMETATETATPEEIPPTPTPTLDIKDLEVPDPEPGLANVVGRIFWNDFPAIELGLLLCENMTITTGCEGARFSSRTDVDGIYLFANIDPGQYDLVVETLNGEHWLYVTAGLKSQDGKYTVEADTTLRIPDQAVYNLDLVFLSPKEEESVSEARPKLSWKPYSEAAYYLVYLDPLYGPPILAGRKTVTASITPPEDLLSCEYSWQVEAYNSQGTKIGEHFGYGHFSVEDQPFSCYLQVVAPRDGAEIGGVEILLEWRPHESAAYYRVHILDADDNDLLEGVRVENEVAYTVPEYLEPAEYRWYVSAYDSDDKLLAQSEYIRFTVIG